MSRVNLDDARLHDCTLMQGNRFGVEVMALTGSITLSRGAQVLFIDPNGAGRNVQLWASPRLGDWAIIFNTADAAEVITVQANGGAGLTPAITPTQSEAAFLVFNGTSWVGFVALGA